MAFPVRPILGRVIIKIEELGEVVSDGGIITDLESARSEKKREGTNRVGIVIAFDEAFYDSPRNAPHVDTDGVRQDRRQSPGLKVGERIFFQSSWLGESFEVGGVEYHTLEGYDVAAFVDKGVRVEAMTR